MQISSYPSIYNLGHKALEGMFDEAVLIEEKIDGSQFSFGIIEGELRARSKGKELIIDAPEKMFGLAVEVIKGLQDRLTPGWTYRGEYLSKPKHNTLVYSRIPAQHIILYDIMQGPEHYVSAEVKAAEGLRLGLEVVPAFYMGIVDSLDMLKQLAQSESCLGGVIMEGVVAKNYNRFTLDKKIMMAKYVREEFKEAHSTSWKLDNPKTGDVIVELIKTLKTDARWRKSIQHLRENGTLTDSPKDIGPLVKEIAVDVKKECEDYIKDQLFNYAWSKVSRGITAGFAEWYKDELAKAAFPEAVEEGLTSTET